MFKTHKYVNNIIKLFFQKQIRVQNCKNSPFGRFFVSQPRRDKGYGRMYLLFGCFVGRLCRQTLRQYRKAVLGYCRYDGKEVEEHKIYGVLPDGHGHLCRHRQAGIPLQRGNISAGCCGAECCNTA